MYRLWRKKLWRSFDRTWASKVKECDQKLGVLWKVMVSSLSIFPNQIPRSFLCQKGVSWTLSSFTAQLFHRTYPGKCFCIIIPGANILLSLLWWKKWNKWEPCDKWNNFSENFAYLLNELSLMIAFNWHFSTEFIVIVICTFILRVKLLI